MYVVDLHQKILIKRFTSAMDVITSKISEVVIPYATKLFFQTLAAVGILPHINTKIVKIR